MGIRRGGILRITGMAPQTVTFNGRWERRERMSPVVTGRRSIPGRRDSKSKASGWDCTWHVQGFARQVGWSEDRGWQEME